LFGGRGSGKTATGAQEALKKISQGLPGAVFNPDFENFRLSTWPEFREWIPWDYVILEDKRMQDPNWSPWRPFTVGFTTGAVVWCKGLKDPGAARGPNINWLWYDEGGRDKTGEGWNVAIGSVRIGPDPQAWVTTTPKGKKHWLYRKFILQELPAGVEIDIPMGDLYAWERVTIHDNKANLDPAFYMSLVATYQGRFAEQELEGLFIEAGEGLVYWNFGPDNIASPAERAEFSLDNGWVEIAYDDGFSVSPRVFLFIQRGDDGVIRVFDELYQTKRLPAETIGDAKTRVENHVKGACRRLLEGAGIEFADDKWLDQIEYLRGKEFRKRVERMLHVEIAVGDPSAAQLKESFRRANIPARAPKRLTVEEGVKKTLNFIRNKDGVVRTLIHPRCRNLIYEMSEGYRYPEGSTSGKPLKEDDHGPDAYRYWVDVRGGRGI